MIEQAFLNLSIGLLILICVNIVLGSINAVFDKQFDVVRFFKGLGKGAIVVLCAGALYYAGALNPDIIAVNINGQNFDIISAINAVVLVGYGFYAKQVFEKLGNMLSGKVDVQEIGEGEI